MRIEMWLVGTPPPRRDWGLPILVGYCRQSQRLHSCRGTPLAACYEDMPHELLVYLPVCTTSGQRHERNMYSLFRTLGNFLHDAAHLKVPLCASVFQYPRSPVKEVSTGTHSIQLVDSSRVLRPRHAGTSIALLMARRSRSFSAANSTRSNESVLSATRHRISHLRFSARRSRR